MWCDLRMCTGRSGACAVTCRARRIANFLDSECSDLPKEERLWIEQKIECAYKHSQKAQDKTHLVQAGYYSPVE